MPGTKNHPSRASAGVARVGAARGQAELFVEAVAVAVLMVSVDVAEVLPGVTVD